MTILSGEVFRWNCPSYSEIVKEKHVDLDMLETGDSSMDANKFCPTS